MWRLWRLWRLWQVGVKTHLSLYITSSSWFPPRKRGNSECVLYDKGTRYFIHYFISSWENNTVYPFPSNPQLTGAFYCQFAICNFIFLCIFFSFFFHFLSLLYYHLNPVLCLPIFTFNVPTEVKKLVLVSDALVLNTHYWLLNPKPVAVLGCWSDSVPDWNRFLGIDDLCFSVC